MKKPLWCPNGELIIAYIFMPNSQNPRLQEASKFVLAPQKSIIQNG